MDKVLKDYGWCQVLLRDGDYFIRHDVGGVAIKMQEDKVSKTQAVLAAQDENKAQKITIEILKSS